MTEKISGAGRRLVGESEEGGDLKKAHRCLRSLILRRGCEGARSGRGPGSAGGVECGG